MSTDYDEGNCSVESIDEKYGLMMNYKRKWKGKEEKEREEEEKE